MNRTKIPLIVVDQPLSKAELALRRLDLEELGYKSDKENESTKITVRRNSLIAEQVIHKDQSIQQIEIPFYLSVAPPKPQLTPNFDNKGSLRRNARTAPSTKLVTIEESQRPSDASLERTGSSITVESDLRASNSSTGITLRTNNSTQTTLIREDSQSGQSYSASRSGDLPIYRRKSTLDKPDSPYLASTLANDKLLTCLNNNNPRRRDSKLQESSSSVKVKPQNTKKWEEVGFWKIIRKKILK
ncbi:hypothetical protein HK098_003528 [Nowakowskiella sp. JEL0407]|nr:hypothetical protein HK098_003528 [Nowakowskiella sp. JEL0407]